MYSKMLYQEETNIDMFYQHFYPLNVAANGNPATPYMFDGEPNEIYIYFHANGNVMTNVNPTTGVINNNQLWRRNSADTEWTSVSTSYKFTVTKSTSGATKDKYRIALSSHLSSQATMGICYICNYATESSIFPPHQPANCVATAFAKNTYPTTTNNLSIPNTPRIIYLYANNSNTYVTDNKFIYTNQNPTTGDVGTTVWKYTQSTGIWENANTTFSVDSTTNKITLNSYGSTTTNTWCTWLWEY